MAEKIDDTQRRLSIERRDEPAADHTADVDEPLPPDDDVERGDAA